MKEIYSLNGREFAVFETQFWRSFQGTKDVMAMSFKF